MKEQIKQLRINIDGLSQLTKNLNPITKGYIGEPIPNTNKEGINSQELDNAYTSLILAKAWLGKLLGELGEATPYTNDGNRKDVKDIEPTADVSKIVFGMRDSFNTKTSQTIDTFELNNKSMNFYSAFNHIEKVDWLREEIKKIIDEAPDFSEKYLEIELEQGFVYKYLCEARFWLGFELQRIKENK